MWWDLLGDHNVNDSGNGDDVDDADNDDYGGGGDSEDGLMVMIVIMVMRLVMLVMRNGFSEGWEWVYNQVRKPLCSRVSHQNTFFIK